MPGIYVISHPQHMPVWKRYRAEGFKIISSWIDNYDFLKPRFIPEWLLKEQELYVCSCVFCYSASDDLRQVTAIADLGIAIAHQKTIFALGKFPGINFFSNHPNFSLKPFPEWDVRRTLQACADFDRTGVADEIRKRREGVSRAI